jgi:3-oxoacyl-[acyl-carrier protein] reductase
MREHGNGRIVNISSMAGKNVTVNGNPAYTSGKWGVIGLTKHMARDLGPEVRVNALCPGGSPNSPMGRWAEPEDIANGVHFLVAPESEYVQLAEGMAPSGPRGPSGPVRVGFEKRPHGS